MFISIYVYGRLCFLRFFALLMSGLIVVSVCWLSRARGGLICVVGRFGIRETNPLNRGSGTWAKPAPPKEQPSVLEEGVGMAVGAIGALTDCSRRSMTS